MKSGKRMESVVFLDVDGVLNTRKTCVHTPSGKYVGVDDARIAILAKAMKQTGAAGVILTSTWKTMKEDDEDYIYLVKNLDKYGIKILGKTQDERIALREEGIRSYLERHPEVEEFVILDDQHYGYKDYNRLYESFIDTQAKGIEHGVAASKTPSVSAILFLEQLRVDHSLQE